MEGLCNVKTVSKAIWKANADARLFPKPYEKTYADLGGHSVPTDF